jgi:hypothetical protein
MYRGVCCDPGWGPGGFGSPDPALLATLGIRRVRIISRRGLEWYTNACWANNIYVRAVVVDGYYCQADEYVVLNEPNLNDVSAEQFAEELQIHRREGSDRVLIAGSIADAPAAGIDGVDYLRRVQAAGGLSGYQGVSIHYPASAARMAAFKKYASGLPVHIGEYNPEPADLSDYLAKVVMPNARTADYFCVNDGMADPSWTKQMGLFNRDWTPKPVLRHWLSLT